MCCSIRLLYTFLFSSNPPVPVHCITSIVRCTKADFCDVAPESSELSRQYKNILTLLSELCSNFSVALSYFSLNLYSRTMISISISFTIFFLHPNWPRQMDKTVAPLRLGSCQRFLPVFPPSTDTKCLYIVWTAGLPFFCIHHAVCKVTETWTSSNLPIGQWFKHNLLRNDARE